MSCSEPSRRRARRRCLATAWALGLTLAARQAGADVLSVRPFGAASEQYSDNINFSDDPMADFVTSFNVGLGLAYTGPRLTAYLAGSNSAQIYALDTNDDSAAASQFATLGTTYAATPRLTLSLADGFTRIDNSRGLGPPVSSVPAPGPVPPGDPGNQAGLLLPRGETLSNSVYAQAHYLFTPRLSGSASYTNSLNSFTDPGGTDMVNRAMLSLGYLLQPNWTGSAFYSFEYLDFSDQPDTISNNPGVGVQWQIDPTWSAGGSLGVFVNQSVGSGPDDLPQRVGPTFQLYLDGSFERWSLNAGAGQQVTNSGGVAGLSITPYAYVGANYQALRDLNVYTNFTYSHFDTVATKYDLLQAIVGLRWSINRYLAAGLSYAHNYSNNDVTTAALSSGSLNANVVMLSLSGSYEVWRGSTSDLVPRL